MTRQRLEGSIRWETQLSISSFSQKILKKIQYLAFTEKVKIVNCYIPEKAKFYIETNLLEELKYFQKKYSFEVKIFSDNKLIIPEYKIDLLNKSKKLIKKFEKINPIVSKTTIIKKSAKEKKSSVKETEKSKERSKKQKKRKS